MSKSQAARLLIVESPGKVKKIQGYLGSTFRVLASMGHVRDLPPDELGLAIENGFAPRWTAVPGKGAVIKRLVKAMQDAEAIYLATDPDREGEAIAAHILALTRLAREKPVMRVTFTAITQAAVRQAVENPRRLDMHLVAAQHARRKLDRLVGYLVSPLACRVLDGRYSAGRVQSPALRLVVERERVIQSFTATPYYGLDIRLRAADGALFKVKVSAVQGQTLPLQDSTLVNKLVGALQQAVYWVSAVQTETVARQPPAPFTTSTLQQAASSTLGFAPDKTMQLAQTLYEAGLITYMRTDAAMIAPEAQTAAAVYIEQTYGDAYRPTTAPQYQRQAHAQEAHEAVRPNDVRLTPDQVRLDHSGESATLYELIWQRFVASQMSPAVDQVQVVTIQAGKQVGQAYPITLEARGVVPQFAGFRQVYQAAADVETDEEVEAESALPPLAQGQVLRLHQVTPQTKNTQPPARYTEAQLVQALEKQGIGRPSTYAAILSNLKERHYVQVERKRLLPTPAGIRLVDYLTASFAPILAYDYTARLETALDEVAAGRLPELDALNSLWAVLHPLLRGATAEAAQLPAVSRRPELQKTGEVCPQCGAELVYRTGKKGQFVGCTAFPKCRYTVGLEQTPLVLRPAQT